MSGGLDVKRKLRNTRKRDGVLRATSVSILSCECDPHSVWVRLHNLDGEVFAVAVMTADAAKGLATDISICAIGPGRIGAGQSRPAGQLH